MKSDVTVSLIVNISKSMKMQLMFKGDICYSYHLDHRKRVHRYFDYNEALAADDELLSALIQYLTRLWKNFLRLVRFLARWKVHQHVPLLRLGLTFVVEESLQNNLNQMEIFDGKSNEPSMIFSVVVCI